MMSMQSGRDSAMQRIRHCIPVERSLYDKAIEDVGEANAMIFEIHQMMLEDLDYLESIENIIQYTGM